MTVVLVQQEQQEQAEVLVAQVLLVLPEAQERLVQAEALAAMGQWDYQVHQAAVVVLVHRV